MISRKNYFQVLLDIIIIVMFFFSVPVKLREVHLKPNSVPSTTDSAEDGSVSTSEELIFYCFPMLDGIVDPHTVIGKKHA